jgi:hypothetical protein
MRETITAIRDISRDTGSYLSDDFSVAGSPHRDPSRSYALAAEFKNLFCLILAQSTDSNNPSSQYLHIRRMFGTTVGRAARQLRRCLTLHSRVSLSRLFDSLRVGALAFWVLLLLVVAGCGFRRDPDAPAISTIQLSLAKLSLTVMIHSSRATLSRLKVAFGHYKVNLPTVHFFCVLAAGIVHPPGMAVIEVPCTDRCTGLDGLVCRDKHAYAYFASRPELGSWLYRIMDDSFLNVTNVLKLIYKLNQVYDPTGELVMRGFGHSAMRHMFLGGGSGWLMSRPLVALHGIWQFSFERLFYLTWPRQDDTTESMILDQIFPSADAWRDPLWSESCDACNGSAWVRGDFSSVPGCPPDHPTYSMNSIIAFHPRHNSDAIIAARLLGSLPPQLHFYAKPRSTSAIPCMSSSGESFEPTVASIRATAVHETIQSIVKHPHRVKNRLVQVPLEFRDWHYEVSRKGLSAELPTRSPRRTRPVRRRPTTAPKPHGRRVVRGVQHTKQAANGVRGIAGRGHQSLMNFFRWL